MVGDSDRGLTVAPDREPWIRQSVQRAVANNARTIRVPVHVVERQQKLEAQALARVETALAA